MPKLPRLSLARVVFVAATLVVGYLVFTAAGELFLSQQLEREEQRLQRDVARLQRQQVELEAIREYLKTDEYVEGVARHTLGLVRPGETLVIISSAVPVTPTPEASTEDGTRRWWELLYGQ